MNKNKKKKELLLQPLCEAVANNEEYSFRALVQQEGVDIDCRDYNNLTPLFYAVLFRRVYMAKILIEHGADIEFRDEYGNTPLLKACLNRDEEMIKLLISYGAEINVTNNYGTSPISISRVSVNFPEIEEFKS